MKFHLVMMLAVLATTAAALDNEHTGLRHRELKCTKKGDLCGLATESCCGKAECRDAMCCLPDGVKGCDDDDDCCQDLKCNDSACGQDGPTDGGRLCGIHGDECTNDGNSNSCCGSTKYLCGEVVDLSGIRCCMPLGTKGCSSDSHCCGSKDGNKCEESRCVDVNGEYPGDAPGGRKCALKGEICSSAGDCCGSTRFDCDGKVCCIKSSLSGCEFPDDCCSGNCDTATSTCVAV